jgi:predicted GNAT family N-acyltransferase
MKYVPLFEKFILQSLEDEFGIELELWDSGEHLQLGKIIIPKSQRGQGVGTKVMQSIVDYADRLGKEIRLTPSTSFGATSTSRLTKFYQQFNFEKNKDYRYSDTMVRYPQ